ncbi:hypothetical protein IRJ41_005707 [Triplophysa rosa]|uniref:Uncharacterized protein n=1 Tax=Triplophysa rosa TaxID=992332 RepID=A0A9W7WSF0_TRIRA|nr:hypothetical protein IRJ41_005707 [Triplophysa rosa]
MLQRDISQFGRTWDEGGLVARCGITNEVFGNRSWDVLESFYETAAQARPHTFPELLRGKPSLKRTAKEMPQRFQTSED